MRFLNYYAVHVGKVFQCGPESPLCEPFPSFRIALFRAFAKSKQGFRAAKPLTSSYNIKDLLRRHVGRITRLLR